MPKGGRGDGWACKAVKATYPEGWKLERRPKCNRAPGHEGLHQERDKRTFRVLAEWSDAEVRAS